MTDDRPPRDISEQAIGGGDDIGLPRRGFAFKALAAASLNGKIFGSEAARLTRELLKVVAGSSTVAPPKGDKRFADPAWSANPMYRRVMQAYLVSSAGLDRIVDQRQYAEKDVTRAQAASFAAAVIRKAADGLPCAADEFVSDLISDRDVVIHEAEPRPAAISDCRSKRQAS